MYDTAKLTDFANYLRLQRRIDETRRIVQLNTSGGGASTSGVDTVAGEDDASDVRDITVELILLGDRDATKVHAATRDLAKTLSSLERKQNALRNKLRLPAAGLVRTHVEYFPALCESILADMRSALSEIINSHGQVYNVTLVRHGQAARVKNSNVAFRTRWVNRMKEAIIRYGILGTRSE